MQPLRVNLSLSGLSYRRWSRGWHKRRKAYPTVFTAKGWQPAPPKITRAVESLGQAFGEPKMLRAIGGLAALVEILSEA